MNGVPEMGKEKNKITMWWMTFTKQTKDVWNFVLHSLVGSCLLAKHNSSDDDN